jgi:hypothetical protein
VEIEFTCGQNLLMLQQALVWVDMPWKDNYSILVREGCTIIYILKTLRWFHKMFHWEELGVIGVFVLHKQPFAEGTKY